MTHECTTGCGTTVRNRRGAEAARAALIAQRDANHDQGDQ